MAKLSPDFQEIPVDIVGFTGFGRYPKISSEVTYNMIGSDGFLVPFAGHKKIMDIDPKGVGRGIFNSERHGKLIVVIDDGIYVVDKQEYFTKVGTIGTSDGDVSIDENDANQIAICDKKNIYIYDTNTGAITKVTDNSDFTPGYVSFHDTYFIAPDINQPKWRLSGNNDGLSWDASFYGLFQTKPDNVAAVVRVPGKGNQILVLGNIVTESWQDVGAQLFPYQRSTGFNIDYGVLNTSTIAFGDTFVIWLGINEKSGPVIMYCDGSNPVQISNDGINFKLAQLKNPTKAHGYLFKQDGHLLYVISFTDLQDNFTLAYDFNTQKFISLCDENMNYHIAKKVVFFNNKYYFISFKDGCLYELNSKYTTFDGNVIPRVRITKNLRMPDSSPFVINNLNMTIEEGENTNNPNYYGVENVVRKGDISSPSDFPSISIVNDGWIFDIIANVYDNDENLTNTGEYFLAGERIMWLTDRWIVLKPQVSRVDLAVSYDGGATFSGYNSVEMNEQGNRTNIMRWFGLGRSNDVVLQFRFWSSGRIVVTNGTMSIYQ